jgi:hypothetical protein
MLPLGLIGHHECFAGQFTIQSMGYHPAHWFRGKQIQNNDLVHPALAGLDIGHVTTRDWIGARYSEWSVQMIGSLNML